MQKLTLLSCQNRAPRTPITLPSIDQLRALFLRQPGSILAVDLETKGVDASHPDSEIVGIGLANENGCVYIDLRTSPQDLVELTKLMLRHSRLVAFNSLFDGAFLQKWLGEWPTFEGCAYGLYKQLTSEGYTQQSYNLESAQMNVLGWEVSNKDALSAALKERGLTKADMWQLPASILGPYCASDADAAWQLWQCLVKVGDEYPAVLDYHKRLFMTEVRLLAEQQFTGMAVDQDLLHACHADLELRIASSLQAFLDHPKVAHHVAGKYKEVHDSWKESQPPLLTATGTPSKRHDAWLAREAKLVGFNVNSKPQLAELFYGTLGYKCRQKTPTGRPVVDRKVLPGFGEPGKLLTAYNVLHKRRGYVEAVIAKSARDGMIHSQWNSVGTVTGRLGGSGGLNLQQMPKDKTFLKALAARPRHVLVQFDFVALEPIILAEFSQDKTLLQLYGPGAKAQDIYLFIAAKIPALGAEIRKYYDPDNPTPEGIAAAKKYCKVARSVAKIVQLASSYGAGATKIHETLLQAGIEIGFLEVQKILRDYWTLFAGVKRFDRQLGDMWNNSGGYVLNALGRPICVAEALLKDVTNRMVQSSGHDCLQLFIYYLDKLRTERNLPWKPWILDLHDEVIVEVSEQGAEAVVQSFVDALALTNQELGMGISLKGEPQIARSLADIKTEG